MKEERISTMPTAGLKALKMPKSLPKYAEEPEINTMLDQMTLSDDYQEALESAIVILLYHTGIRKAELVGLKLQNVQLNNSTIKVLGKRNKERIIPIGEEAIEFLKQYDGLRRKTHKL